MNTQIRGWVYILTNESFPDLIKIGFSLKDPNLRAQELNSTGLPYPFKLAYEAFTFEPYQKEQAVHSKLKSHGYHENKEFFCCDVHYAIELLQDICGDELIDESLYVAAREPIIKTGTKGTNSNKFIPGNNVNLDRDLRGTNGYKLDGNSIVKDYGMEKLTILKSTKLANGLLEYIVADRNGVKARLVFSGELERLKSPYDDLITNLSTPINNVTIQNLTDIVETRKMYAALFKKKAPDRGKNESVDIYISRLKDEMLFKFEKFLNA